MAKTIAMLNMKGGVGKTTLAVNIASALAKIEGKKVLLIDLDPQYNATQYLMDVEANEKIVDGSEKTVLDIMAGGKRLNISVLRGKKVLPKNDVTLNDVARPLYNGKKGKLDLIPGTLHLINLELANRGKEHRLQNFVKKIKDAYDFIIIDCPPTFSIFLLSGFLASDYYLVPLKPDPLSTLGVPLLESVLDSYSSDFEKESKPLGVVFVMVRETNEMDKVMEGIRNTSVGKRYVFKNKLTFSTYIAEASRHNKALFEYNKSKKYGKEIIAITKELLTLI